MAAMEGGGEGGKVRGQRVEPCGVSAETTAATAHGVHCCAQLEKGTDDNTIKRRLDHQTCGRQK